jgi:hypothetical protein
LVWFFSELDFLQKTYWTAVFKDLDGLISDQSTSDTKVVWLTLLHKSESALSGVYRFYGCRS